MAVFRDYPGEPVPKGKINLDFTEARDSEWQWHITTPAHHHSVFLQAGCPSCRPTNSVKALKALS